MPDESRSPVPVFPAGTGSPAKSFRRPRPWLSWLTVGAGVGLIAYVLFLHPSEPRSARGARSRDAAAGSALPVTAEPARRADLDLRIVALGTVTPVATVTVRSRVDGELQKIFFNEGESVEAGAPLADLDARPFEVLKLQGEAQLAKDDALLENARVDLKRFQTLLAEDSVAEQQVETQAALVRQYEAATKVDHAQLQSAELQLTYAHVTAPIAGRIGLRYVDRGNIVHAADAAGLAMIAQLHPITVLFSVPQDSVPQVSKRFAAKGPPMEVQAFDRDGHTLLATGKLVTVDNEIDPTTGTLKLRAEFPNADDALFPNQFVNVQVVVDQLKAVTVVPTAAVQRGTAGMFVYVVGPENKALVRPVETGPTEQGMIAVSKGLSPGEIVVVDGVDKLREGSVVELIGRDESAPATPNPKVSGRPGKSASPRAGSRSISP